MICIYESGATDFTTMGLGSLNPTSCSVTQTLNGEWELTLEHAIDDTYKWSMLREGRILKVPVPASKTPSMTVSGGGMTSKDIYTIDTNNGQRLYLRTAPDINAKTIGLYKHGTEVIVLSTSDTPWYETETDDGKHGWMHSTNLRYTRTETTGSAAEEIIVSKTQMRDQPMRIYRIVPELNKTTVYARHIFYDLMDNMVLSYKPQGAVTGIQAINGLMAACHNADHGFRIYSDVTATAEELDFENINPVEAIFGEEGLCEKYNAEVIFDWFDIYFVNRVGEDSGMSIRQGRDLLGVSYDLDETNVVTRIIPTGTNDDDTILYHDPVYMDSPYIADYPEPRYYHLEVSDAKVSREMPVADALRKLEEAAQAEFDKGCDVPTVTVNVDFLCVKDTEEYRQYAQLKDLFLGDTVRVTAPRAGVDVSLRMTQYTFDCLTRKYTSITLGEISDTIETSMISARQIAAGTIRGGKLMRGTVDGTTLKDGAVTSLKIGYAAVREANIGTAAITTAKIDDAAITTAKIDDAAVTTAKIGLAQVKEANIDLANIDWADIQTLRAVYAFIENGIITNAAIDQANVRNLNAHYAEITNGHINTALIDDGTITTAQISSANIGYANVKDLVSGTQIFTDGVGSKLYIARLAVTEANMVSLTVGELMLKTASGDFVRLMPDGHGGVTTQTVEVEGDNIAASTIPGGKLIENTITARELNVEQIFADQAMIRVIKSANIDVAELFAAQATINELNSWVINAQTISALEGALDIWAKDKINMTVSLMGEGRQRIQHGNHSMFMIHSKYHAPNDPAVGTVTWYDAPPQDYIKSCMLADLKPHGVGNNIMSGAYELGEISSSTGQDTSSRTAMRSVGYTPVTGGADYWYTSTADTPCTTRMRFYDESYNYIGYSGQVSSPGKFTPPANARYMRLMTYSGSAGWDQIATCIISTNEYTLFEIGGTPIKPYTAYTISFNSWQYGIAPSDADTEIKVNLFNNDLGVDVDIGSFTPTVATPTKVTLTFNTGDCISGYTATDVLAIRFISWGSWTIGDIYISDVKLEEGSYSSDWSPAPEDARTTEASLQLSLNGIAGRVSDAEGNITTITQNQTGINARLTSAEGGISTLNASTEALSVKIGATMNAGQQMIRFADHSKFGATANAAVEWQNDEDKLWYTQSGMFAHIAPHTTGYEEISVNYKSIRIQPDTNYTVSFYCWKSGLADDVTLLAGLWDGDDYAQTFVTVHPSADGIVRMSGTINTADVAGFTASDCYLRLYTTDNWNAGYVWISDIKLETGSAATQWTPHPEEFIAGSSVVMTDDNVMISTPVFDVNVQGTDGDLHLDENGLTASTATFDTVTCPMIARKTDGRACAAYAGDDLQRECERIAGGMLTGAETVTLEADQYGDIYIHGVYTDNSDVTINGNGHSIFGKLVIANCRALRITLINITVNASAGNTAIDIYGSGHVWIDTATINAASGCDGIRTHGASNLMIVSTGIYNASTAIDIDYGGALQFVQCRGTSTTALYAKLCTVCGAITRPGGNVVIDNAITNTNIAGITVDTSGGGSSPSTPTTTEFTTTNAQTFYTSPNSHWHNDGIIRQGTQGTGSGFERDYGVMWFGGASAIGSRTVVSATLTITRERYGRSGSVNVTLYTTPVTSAGGNARTGAESVGTVGTIGNGETKSFTLPTSCIEAIIDGGALMLDPGDTANASGKTYSANYTRFSNAVLTVSYQ